MKLITRHIAFSALFLTGLLFSISAQAQDDPQFAQYQFSRSLFNAAANGAEDGFSGLLMHRSQWAGFSDAPMSQGVSLQGGLKSINSGIGLNITNSGYGVTNQLSIGLAYAYHLKIGKKSRLSFGIQGDLKVNSESGSRLTTTGTGDEAFQRDVTLYNGNFGAGLMYHGERFYVGVSTTRFLQNTVSYATKTTAETSFDITRVPYYASAGYAFLLSPSFSLMPSFMVRGLADQPFLADFNLNLKYKDIFWVGPYYRFKAAVGGMAGVNIGKHIRIGYAGEFPMSAVSPYSKGSHEIFIGFNFRKKTSGVVPSIRYF
jgi:type IX secretion system PorP/SprF family membrane protein